jgi:hypothetical protein
VKPEQRDALQREILGNTRERMVREICEALEGAVAQTPLLVILEDLHWVDPSTLDLISAFACAEFLVTDRGWAPPKKNRVSGSVLRIHRR